MILCVEYDDHTHARTRTLMEKCVKPLSIIIHMHNVM